MLRAFVIVVMFPTKLHVSNKSKQLQDIVKQNEAHPFMFPIFLFLLYQISV